MPSQFIASLHFIPKNALLSGQTSPARTFPPHSAAQTWIFCALQTFHPHSAAQTWMYFSSVEKCPGKRHKSGRKQKNGDPQASIIRKCKSTDSHLILILLNLRQFLVSLCNLACKVCLEFLKLGKQVSICTCKNLHCKDSCILCTVQRHCCNRNT